MKVQLISYVNDLSDSDKLKNTVELINQSESDLILFSGWTISTLKELTIVKKAITNTSVQAIVELADFGNGLENCLYLLRNGEFHNMFSNQFFFKSADLNIDLAEWFIQELKTRRLIEIDGKKILIIQCGENNILHCPKGDSKAYFRYSQDRTLAREFSNLLSNVDIILNPIHTPMSEGFGIMSKRRQYFSENSRAYFSTSNTCEGSDDITSQGLQFGFFNGEKIQPIVEPNGNSQFVSSIYEII